MDGNWVDRMEPVYNDLALHIMNRATHAAVIGTLALNAIHGIFHLADWLVWGFQLSEPHLRPTLGLLFGHHMLGWFLHAATNLSLILVSGGLYLRMIIRGKVIYMREVIGRL